MGTPFATTLRLSFGRCGREGVGAGDVGDDLAGLDGRVLKLAAVGVEIVDDGVGDVDGLGHGNGAGAELEVLGVEGAVAGDGLAVGGDVGVDVAEQGDAAGGIEDADACGIEMMDGELGVEVSVGGVFRVDRAGFAVELDGALGGKVGGEGEWELLFEGELIDFEVDVVALERSAVGGQAFDDGVAVGDGELIDVEVGEVLGLRIGVGGMADRGEVPLAVGGVDEMDAGGVDGQGVDEDLVMEEQRDELDSDVEGLGGEEGLLAELRVVGDVEVVGGDAAGEEGEAKVTEGDLAVERGGELLLDERAEAVDVDEERDAGEDDDDHAYGYAGVLDPGFQRFHSGRSSCDEMQGG